MRRINKIISFVVMGTIAVAAVFCCCTQSVAARAIAASSVPHSCCPVKSQADPLDQYFCPYQLSQSEKVSSNSYQPSLLVKDLDHSLTTVQPFLTHALAEFAGGSMVHSAPDSSAIPLYLRSHKLRL